MRAFFIFTVFEADLTDMTAAAGYFNADDFAAAVEVNTVVVDLTLVLVVHDFITSLYIVG
jgi:hypothetical protein